MTDLERDDQFGTLLASSLARAAEGGADCPEPGTMAAFMDGTLTPAERAAVVTHAATCAACQARLSAMARSAEPSRVPGAGWLRGWRRWALPLVAGSAAMFIWVIVRQGTEGDTVAMNSTRVASSPRQELDSATDSRVEPAGPSTAPPAPQANRPVALAPELKREAATAGAASQPAAPAVRADKISPRELPLPSLAGRRPPPSTEPVLVEHEAPKPQTAGETAALADADRARLLEEVGQRSARRGEPQAAPVMAAAAKENQQLVAPLVVHAPGGSIAWRALGGLIQRTIDGGTSWRSEADTGGAAWLAGTAPSGDACWLGGTGGRVARRAPDGRWDVVTLPRAEDVIRIEATSGDSASAAQRDGTIYDTQDGGRTWIERGR